AANRDPDFVGVFTLFSTRSPSIYTDIDRLKAEKVGLTPTDVFSTLQVYLGSQYVDDFNYLGRSYEVVVQGDGAFRRTTQDITRLKARNTAGEMVPIGTAAKNAILIVEFARQKEDEGGTTAGEAAVHAART